MKYFNEKEFRSKDQKDIPVKLDDVFIAFLDRVRELKGSSIHINSGYRTPSDNRRVGGSPTSKHLLLPVQAADLRVSSGAEADKTLSAIYQAEAEFKKEIPGFQKRVGIKRKSGEAKGFIHLDTAGSSVAWTY